MEEQGRDLVIANLGRDAKDFDAVFYQNMRDVVNNQTDTFNAVLESIERVVDAAHETHLLPHNRPSAIPREDFTMDEIPASVIEAQLETARNITIHHKKSVPIHNVDGNEYKRLVIGDFTLNALDDEDVLPEKREGNPLVFSITGIFGERKIVVTVNRKKEMRVRVVFPKRKVDKHSLEYRFIPLPLTGNTQEEGFLALYLLRSAHLAMFDPAIEGKIATPSQTQ